MGRRTRYHSSIRLPLMLLQRKNKNASKNNDDMQISILLAEEINQALFLVKKMLACLFDGGRNGEQTSFFFGKLIMNHCGAP